MSNSNGMYRVLDIFKKLEPTQEQKVKAEAKAIYESVEAKGSILEGVSKTEKKLQEKYMGFKESKQLDELSPETVSSYQKKAYSQAADASNPKSDQRAAGVARSLSRPTNEDQGDLRSAILDVLQTIQSGASAGEEMIDVLADELNQYYDDVEQSNDGALQDAYFHMMDQGQESEGNPEMMASIAGKAIELLDQPSLDEGEKVKTKTGYIHKGTYGDADFDDDGKEVKKHVPKKGQRGRPKKEKPAEFNAPKGDIFGRTTGKTPKGKKGTVVKGKAMSHDDNNRKDDLDEMWGDPYHDDAKVDAINAANPPKAPAGQPNRMTATPAKHNTPAPRGRETLDHDEWDKFTGRDKVQEKAPPGAKAERMVKHIKQGYAKDGKLTDKEKSIAFATAWKAHKKGKVEESRRLSEGVNFTEMLKKHSMTLEEMMKELSNDIMEFKRSGHVSDTLKDCMSVYEYGKQQLTDGQHTQHALDLNPDLKRQAQPPKPTVLGKVGDIAKKGLDVLTGPDDEGLMRDLAKRMYNEDEELKELARLAGLTLDESSVRQNSYATTGPEGYNALMQMSNTSGIEIDPDEETQMATVTVLPGVHPEASAALHKLVQQKLLKPIADFTHRNVGAVPTRPGVYEQDDFEEGNEFSGELAKAKAAGKKEFEVDGKKYPVKEDTQLDECGMSPMGSAAQQMDQEQGKMNISTNISSDGHKNVSINADGDAADQLMAMLKMAGLGGATQKSIAIAIPTGSAEGMPEEVSEADAEYANVPKEEYEGVDAIVNQGDDMNRQKKQFADKPKAGDNPMATENFDPIGELGRNLMKEYQSLKVKK